MPEQVLKTLRLKLIEDLLDELSPKNEQGVDLKCLDRQLRGEIHRFIEDGLPTYGTLSASEVKLIQAVNRLSRQVLTTLEVEDEHEFCALLGIDEASEKVDQAMADLDSCRLLATTALKEHQAHIRP